MRDRTLARPAGGVIALVAERRGQDRPAAAGRRVLRRSLPAFDVAFGAFPAARMSVALVARPAYATPLIAVQPSARPWPAPVTGRSSTAEYDELEDAANRASTNLNDFLQARGIHQLAVCHPAERFWTFQVIECAGCWLAPDVGSEPAPRSPPGGRPRFATTGRLDHRDRVPFDDETSPDGIAVVGYRSAWVREAAALADELRDAVPASRAIEHIGSTAVPGMAAKDCLDMMIVVDDLTLAAADQRLTPLGYRRRPEPWNNLEPADGRDWPKQVYAPPVGARPCNIHVRTAGSATYRRALLFRDHLRSDPQRTAWWSELKAAAAGAAPDLAGYGRIKYPAWCLLMELAETWASSTGWEPPLNPAKDAYGGRSASRSVVGPDQGRASGMTGSAGDQAAPARDC